MEDGRRVGIFVVINDFIVESNLADEGGQTYCPKSME